MGEPVYEQDHRRIVDRIEQYLELSNEAAMGVERWLSDGRGNLRKRLQEFYDPFCALFFATHLTKPMQERNTELYKKIRDWLARQDLSRERLREGVDLFLEYQKELYGSGLLTVKT